MRMQRSRGFVVAVGVVAAMLAVAGCAKNDETSKATTSGSGKSTVDQLKDRGSINIGIKYDQPGFGVKDTTGYSGFDVEVAKIIAKRIGIPDNKITWVETKSQVREEYLIQNKVDLVVATYTINDKRKERVSFAGPYYVAGQSIMVKSDNSTITGPDSLKSQPGVKICSAVGSTPAETIKKFLATESQLVLFDGYQKCVDALRNGQVQAVTTDNVILMGYVADSRGAYKLAGTTFTTEPYGIGIKKGDKEFCEFLNSTLTEASTSGAYKTAWTSTAGKIAGAQEPTLPVFGGCDDNPASSSSTSGVVNPSTSGSSSASSPIASTGSSS